MNTTALWPSNHFLMAAHLDRQNNNTFSDNHQKLWSQMNTGIGIQLSIDIGFVLIVFSHDLVKLSVQSMTLAFGGQPIGGVHAMTRFVQLSHTLSKLFEQRKEFI